MKVIEYKGNNKWSKPFEIDMCDLELEEWDKEAECPCCHKRQKLRDMVDCGRYWSEDKKHKIPICRECVEKIIYKKRRNKNGKK